MLKEALSTVTACPHPAPHSSYSIPLHTQGIHPYLDTHPFPAILCSGAEQSAMRLPSGQWLWEESHQQEQGMQAWEFWWSNCLRTKTRRRCTDSDGHPLGPSTPWGGETAREGQGQVPLTQYEVMTTVQRGTLPVCLSMAAASLPSWKVPQLLCLCPLYYSLQSIFIFRVNFNLYAENHSLWESHIKLKTYFTSAFLEYSIFSPYYEWYGLPR